jgi:glutathione S-transferase
MSDTNFYKGPAHFFAKVPSPLRPLMIAMVRRGLRKTLHGHGLGRHSDAEITALATRSIAAISDYLGSKPFFMGGEPTGIDASMFAFAAGALCPLFDAPIRTAAESRDNLKAYVGRMAARFYPDLKEVAGVKAAA